MRPLQRINNRVLDVERVERLHVDHFARDALVLLEPPRDPASVDRTIDKISELLNHDWSWLKS